MNNVRKIAEIITLKKALSLRFILAGLILFLSFPVFAQDPKLPYRDLDNRTVEEFPKEYLISMDEFNAQFTEDGKLYHGTDKIKKSESIMNNGFIESKGEPYFGNGVFTSKNFQSVLRYTRPNGIVLELKLKQNPNLRILNFRYLYPSESNPYQSSEHYTKTVAEAQAAGMEYNDYLAQKYGIDIIVNSDRIILKNAAAVELPSGVIGIAKGYAEGLESRKLSREDRIVRYEMLKRVLDFASTTETEKNIKSQINFTNVEKSFVDEIAEEGSISEKTELNRIINTSIVTNEVTKATTINLESLPPTPKEKHNAVVSAPGVVDSYYYSSEIYPNLFIPEQYRGHEVPDEVVQSEKLKLERAMSSIFKRLTVVMTDEVTKQTSVKLYFDYILTEVKKIDPGVKLVPSGGVVRATLSYIYEEIKKGSSLDAIIADQRKIRSSEVRGVGSDFDIFAISSNGKFKEISERIQKLTNSSEEEFDLMNEKGAGKRGLFPVADAKDFNEHLKRSVPQGGSVLDFLGFDYEQGKFVEPKEYQHIVDDFIKGSYEYVASTNSKAENFHKQVIRGFRPLVEIPFLRVKDETQLRQEITQSIQEIKQGKFSPADDKDSTKKQEKEKALEQFSKMLRNSRDYGAKNRMWRGKPDSIEQLFLEYATVIRDKVTGGKNPFPEFVQYQDIATRNVKEMPKEFLMSVDYFNTEFTKDGTFNHGSPSLSNALSIIRGGLYESYGANGGAGVYGKGAYSSPDLKVSTSYAGAEGIVFELHLKKNPNIRILEYEKYEGSEHFKTTLEESKAAKMDHFDYLMWKYGIDIIIRQHIIIKNAAAIDIQDGLLEFIKGLANNLRNDQIDINNRITNFDAFQRILRFAVQSGDFEDIKSKININKINSQVMDEVIQKASIYQFKTFAEIVRKSKLHVTVNNQKYLQDHFDHISTIDFKNSELAYKLTYLVIQEQDVSKLQSGDFADSVTHVIKSFEQRKNVSALHDLIVAATSRNPSVDNFKNVLDFFSDQHVKDLNLLINARSNLGHWAASIGKYEFLTELKKRGFTKWNESDANSFDLVQVAAISGKLEFVKYVKEHLPEFQWHLDPDKSVRFFETMIRTGQTEILTYFKDYVPEYWAAFSSNSHNYMETAFKNSKSEISEMIHKNVKDIDYSKMQRTEPQLIQTLEFDDVLAGKALKAKYPNYDWNQKDKYGSSLGFRSMLRKNTIQILEFLRTDVPEYDWNQKNKYETPLAHIAVQNNRLDVLQFIKDKISEYDWTARDKNGQRILDVAFYPKKIEALKILRGIKTIDWNEKDKYEIPLANKMWIMPDGQEDLLQFLKDNVPEYDWTATDKYGTNILNKSFTSGKIEALRVLKGIKTIDWNQKDDYKNTLADLAIQKKNTELLQFLKDHVPEYNWLEGKERTKATLARMGNVEVEKVYTEAVTAFESKSGKNAYSSFIPGINKIPMGDSKSMQDGEFGGLIPNVAKLAAQDPAVKVGLKLGKETMYIASAKVLSDLMVKMFSSQYKDMKVSDYLAHLDEEYVNMGLFSVGGGAVNTLIDHRLARLAQIRAVNQLYKINFADKMILNPRQQTMIKHQLGFFVGSLMTAVWAAHNTPDITARELISNVAVGQVEFMAVQTGLQATSVAVAELITNSRRLEKIKQLRTLAKGLRAASVGEGIPGWILIAANFAITEGVVMPMMESFAEKSQIIDRLRNLDGVMDEVQAYLLEQPYKGKKSCQDDECYQALVMNALKVNQEMNYFGMQKIFGAINVKQNEMEIEFEPHNATSEKEIKDRADPEYKTKTMDYAKDFTREAKVYIQDYLKEPNDPNIAQAIGTFDHVLECIDKLKKSEVKVPYTVEKTGVETYYVDTCQNGEAQILEAEKKLSIGYETMVQHQATPKISFAPNAGLGDLGYKTGQYLATNTSKAKVQQKMASVYTRLRLMAINSKSTKKLELRNTLMSSVYFLMNDSVKNNVKPVEEFLLDLQAAQIQPKVRMGKGTYKQRVYVTISEQDNLTNAMDDLYLQYAYVNKCKNITTADQWIKTVFTKEDQERIRFAKEKLTKIRQAATQAAQPITSTELQYQWSGGATMQTYKNIKSSAFAPMQTSKEDPKDLAQYPWITLAKIQTLKVNIPNSEGKSIQASITRIDGQPLVQLLQTEKMNLQTLNLYKSYIQCQ